MQGDCFEDSYQVNIIINLLVRFPEIFTITYNMASSSYCLSYMMNGEVERRRYGELRRVLEENLEAYHYFLKREHHRLSIRKKNYSNLTQLEIRLPGDRPIDNEVGLITRIIRDSFGSKLISELRAEEGGAYFETSVEQAEIREYFLSRNPGNTFKKLFAFRDSGKVYVFDK